MFSSLRPPSSSISERYSAPFMPQGRVDTSTSNENSWPVSLSISYLSSSSVRRYTLGVTWVPSSDSCLRRSSPPSA